MSRPTYIYKLVSHSTPVPEPIPETLPLSELDVQSGFIHMSTALQVSRTLKRFFAEEPRVYVLRVDYSVVEKDIKWEDSKGEAPGEVGGDGMFAHIYNRGLGAAEIESVVVWERNGGNWDEALKGAESWLVY
ncbi:hypothetical protein FB45DRAFT_903542 [Roridomyces roridus]|uniref:DUF952 domain protein n=1 Tax=Roridomyces roridus TaxID=1738132 RepID=A0AAD7FRF8_9AGAR|nr:hypothetical protein FB45DRAFT_903542 [Roridomyces roridus]